MKKILSLSLALIMMMALVGCDNFNANDQEIVGDARLITDEELTYFNETYFNAMTGQNINIANQFLHGEFATPQDIDLYNLFYLGTGADYILTITKSDENYLIQSNLPMMTEE